MSLSGFLLLSRDTIAVKTLNTGQHLTVVTHLQFRGSVYYHHGMAWGHAIRHGAGEEAESSTSCAGNGKWSQTLAVAGAYMRSQNLPSQ